MDRRHHEILKKIFREQPPLNLQWVDIKSLLTELVKERGVDIREGNGARTRVTLIGTTGDPRLGIFVPPYPDQPASVGLIREVRSFLREVGIIP